MICGLSVAAFAAPLLDIYGRNPEVFVANRTTPGEIVLFGLLIILAVPAVALVISGSQIGSAVALPISPTRRWSAFWQ